MDRHPRRAVLTTAAWMTPTLLVATAAPAFAASCESRTIPFALNANGWGPIVEIQGTHTAASYRQPTNDAVAAGTSWGSLADQMPGADPSSLQYSLTYQLEVTAGTPMTFTTTLGVGYANNAPSTALEQRLDVSVGGATVAKYSTRRQPYSFDQYYPTNTASSDVTTGVGTTRSDGYLVIGRGSTTVTFTVTPTTTGVLPLTFTFWKARAQSDVFLATTLVSDGTSWPTTGTQRSGSDKLTVGPLRLSC